jgi:hypothetical protein
MIEIPTDVAISMVNIIDLAAPRGAFKGPELTQIGNVRTYIANLINEEREGEVNEESGE